MHISGAVAIVTGGGSGLGKATAENLRDAGATVVVVDLPRDGTAEMVASLGDGVTFAPADVTNEKEFASAVEVAASLGPLRVLVNCAGIAPAIKVLGTSGPHSLDQFERAVRVNLVGTFNAIRLAAQEIVKAEPIDGERGVIVNTASVAAFEGQIGQAAYAASKGGVVGLTLPVARELASSLVRVVTIAPGILETPMLAGLPQAAQDSLGLQVPHPSRLGRPSEYAALVAHIISNAYINGETIRLDGGIRMAPR